MNLTIYSGSLCVYIFHLHRPFKKATMMLIWPTGPLRGGHDADVAHWPFKRAAMMLMWPTGPLRGRHDADVAHWPFKRVP